MTAHIVDVLIDLVGDDHHPLVTCQHIGQTAQLVAAVDAARGVAGRAQDDEAGLGGDCSLELGGSDLEVLVEGGGYEYALATGQVDHLHITHPCRRGDDDLVAGVDKRHDRVAQRVLGAVAHDNLLGSVVQAILVLEFGADGLAQRQVAGNGRIEREVVVHGLLGSLFDVVGGEEVGLAHREVNHVDALSLEFGALLRHGQCCAGRKCLNAVRKLVVHFFN